MEESKSLTPNEIKKAEEKAAKEKAAAEKAVEEQVAAEKATAEKEAKEQATKAAKVVKKTKADNVTIAKKRGGITSAQIVTKRG